MPPEARGTREFSSPEVRVRSEQSPPFHVNQRLLLPNERRRRFTLRRIARLLLPLLVLGGIGVGVYFGVYYLLRNDDEPAAPAAEAVAEPAPAAAAEPAAPAAQEQATPAAAGQSDPVAQGAAAQQDAPAEPVAEPAAEQAEPAPEPEPAVHPAQAQPTIAESAVTPADVGGAPLVGERMTAEALPAGIPRRLADDTPYDPADATAAFSNIWPTGTTLRLTRLPGAPLLSEDQVAQVVGTEALVVVRGSESSNTDIQLSAAAFEQLGFYQTERIIAVRAEVVGPPP